MLPEKQHSKGDAAWPDNVVPNHVRLWLCMTILDDSFANSHLSYCVSVCLSAARRQKAAADAGLRLHGAAAAGKVTLIRSLLKRGADVSGRALLRRSRFCRVNYTCSDVWMP